jgi:hypothetical protein
VDVERNPQSVSNANLDRPRNGGAHRGPYIVAVDYDRPG